MIMEKLEQLNIFEVMYDSFKIDKPIRLIELFEKRFVEMFNICYTKNKGGIANV